MIAVHGSKIPLSKTQGGERAKTVAVIEAITLPIITAPTNEHPKEWAITTIEIAITWEIPDISKKRSGAAARMARSIVGLAA